MRIVLLDAATLGEDISLDAFAKFGETDIYATTTAAQTQERIADADIVVTNKVVITREHMLTCKSLQCICIAATGMNNVDLDAAKEFGITVKNVAGYSTDSVIQHTFSMLLYLIGHARYYDEYVASGKWCDSPIFTHLAHPFFEIKGKRWGIVGLGEIGSGVAKVAQTFGARVCYYSTSGKNENRDYARVALDTLLQKCDIISIHAPLNEDTRNLLDYEKLLTCKAGAIVLNLGRGGIIDENAAAKIVDKRDIAFGLDVLESEPMRCDHPLLKVKNKHRLYITPHIAWTSIEARKRLVAAIIENIETFLHEK